MIINHPFRLCFIVVLASSCTSTHSVYLADGSVVRQKTKTSRPIVRQIGEPSPTAKKIVTFAEQHIGKKVGDGQCWGLANLAYLYAGIRHRGGYVWGRRIHWQTEGVRPGDIIQFSNARYPYAYTDENHTAIILKVVVFPQPDGPNNVTNFPASILRSILSTAKTSFPYILVTFLNLTGAALEFTLILFPYLFLGDWLVRLPISVRPTINRINPTTESITKIKVVE